jgi:hypothetical protein
MAAFSTWRSAWRTSGATLAGMWSGTGRVRWLLVAAMCTIVTRLAHMATTNATEIAGGGATRQGGGATRQRARKSRSAQQRRPAAQAQQNTGGNPVTSSGYPHTAQEAFDGVNYLISPYLAGNRTRTLGNTTMIDFVAWCQQYVATQRPKTMAAGASH